MKLCSLVVRLQQIFCFQLDIFHSISTHCWLKEKKVKIGRVIQCLEERNIDCILSQVCQLQSRFFIYCLRETNFLHLDHCFNYFWRKMSLKTAAFSLAAWNRQVSSNDYPSLDSLTKSIVKEKQPFVRLVITKEELLEMFKVIRLSTRATFASDLAIFTSLALSCSVILLRTCSRLICFLYLNVQVLKQQLHELCSFINPLSLKIDQHLCSPNNRHTSSRDKIVRSNKMITKGKLLQDGIRQEIE